MALRRDAETWVCRKCGEEKPNTREFFGSNGHILRGTCKDCRREYLRGYQGTYYANNKELCREIQARSRLNDPDHLEKESAWKKAWIERNPEKARESNTNRNRRWRAKHPEAMRAIWARRYARESSARGSFSPSDVGEIMSIQDGLCFYCGCDIDGGYHVDHWIPLARGGDNDASNIVVSCPACNMKKHDKMPLDFIRSTRPTSNQTMPVTPSAGGE